LRLIGESISGERIKPLGGFIEKADDTGRTFLGLGKREEIESGEEFLGEKKNQ
jgi:hypothetical protein